MTAFDLLDRRFDQLAKFLLLILRDGGLQILDFRQMLAHKYNQSYLPNAAHPGVADQLRIEGQQAFGLLRIPAGRGFPIDQMALAIDLPDGIDIRDELTAMGERTN